FTRSWTGRRESTWGVGFTTSADYDPAALKIAYAQSLISIESAARSLDQVKANLIFEVKKHMRQLLRAHERILLQEEQIQTAKGELLLAQVKFDRGIANNFDVIQAEKSLRTAEHAFWTALIDHIVGQYQLLAAMGLLSDKPAYV